MKAKTKKCVNPECPGKNPRIMGRGLCVTCYFREIAKNNPEKKKVEKADKRMGKKRVVGTRKRRPPAFNVNCLRPEEEVTSSVPTVTLEELYELARSCMQIAKEALELAKDRRKA